MEQSYREAEVEFAVSAIETAAAKAGVTGDVIYRALAAEDGIREFLLPSFEALNTESIDRIADEVILWLREYLSESYSEIGNNWKSKIYKI